MFENNADEPPLASAIYDAVTSVSFVGLQGPYSWGDRQGLVRISMLSGSVDVTAAYFIAAPDSFTYCPVEVAVPEPLMWQLFAVGGTAAGVLLLCRRKQQRRLMT